MTRIARTFVLAASALAAATLAPAAEPPKSWIDPDTGHRIVRLTDEPGSASLYFNQNAYTGDGKKMVYTTTKGISVLDLQSHASRQVVEGRVRVIVAGRKSQNVYYTRDGAVWSTDVDTLVRRKIAELPRRGGISTVNADETMLAGTYIEGDGPDYGANMPAARTQNGAQSAGAPQPQPQTLDQPANKGAMMERRLAAHYPMALFTIDTRSGEVKILHRSTDWLNHLEFSPTDPTLLMFCHEGPWHKVDRIWTMRTDGTHITLVHKRTMQMEIAGHEFWSEDGKTIWYDLQTPRSELFWVAGYNVETGLRTWYHLERNEWSVHFNVSKDGALFCGDGADPGQVAKAKDGQWLYLFRPELTPNREGSEDPALIRPGVFHAERLVNMSKHQYRLEPNVSFTPDRKWIVFRSNMFGESYAFAVEVAKAQ
jgi:oligogalacturonide lyase